MKIKFYKNEEGSGSIYCFLNVMYESATYSKIPSFSYMALNVTRQRVGFQRTALVLKEVIKD